MFSHWDRIEIVSGPLQGRYGRVIGEPRFDGKYSVLTYIGEYDMLDDFDGSELKLVEEPTNV